MRPRGGWVFDMENSEALDCEMRVGAAESIHNLGLSPSVD